MSTEPQWPSAKERATWVQLSAVLELLPATLDAQLRRDADLTLFQYYVLAMLSEAPHQTLQMTPLAAQTNSTLPRLSHVVKRLADRGLVERRSCPGNGRATNVHLTTTGWARLRRCAPGHVTTVRDHVLDTLTPEQVDQLAAITGALLTRLDPEAAMTPTIGRDAVLR